MSNKSKRQQGFTLIELITVVAIIGVLAGLSLTGFSIYRQNAALAVLTRLVGDTVSDVEGSLARPDIVLPAINDYEQGLAGPVTDATARQDLQAVVVPRLVSYRITVDPSCVDSLCIATSLEVRHSNAAAYLTSIRTGDGLWVTAEAM